MEIITFKEFLILLFQMIFLGSSIFMIYISIFNNSILYPDKSKFIIINIKEYIKLLRTIYLTLGILGSLISIFSLTNIIGLNLTGISWGVLISLWTYCDYYTTKKYVVSINSKD